MTLGLGRAGLVRIPVNADFEMRPDALAAAIAADRAAGRRPIAIVGTVGTTSSTSVDPVAPLADIAEREGLWLHVDAAYAGVVALLPERRAPFLGWERADSIVINPHKWLFTPLDASLLLCRRMDVLRAAFSLVPEYLLTLDRDDAGPRLQRVHAPARSALPGPEALDPAPMVRPGGPPPAHRTPPRARHLVRPAGRCGARLGAPRAGPVLDGLFPLASTGLDRHRRGAGPGERRDHGRGESQRCGLPLAHAPRPAGSRSESRSATSGPKRGTSSGPGRCCARRPPRWETRPREPRARRRHLLRDHGRVARLVRRQSRDGRAPLARLSPEGDRPADHRLVGGGRRGPLRGLDRQHPQAPRRRPRAPSGSRHAGRAAPGARSTSPRSPRCVPRAGCDRPGSPPSRRGPPTTRPSIPTSGRRRPSARRSSPDSGRCRPRGPTGRRGRPPTGRPSPTGSRAPRRPETRTRRLESLIADSAAGEKVGPMRWSRRP